MSHPQQVLGVFAKWPTPGTVKTRLAAGTSPEWAAAVADAFLRDILARLAPLDVHRELVYAPADREGAFADLAGSRYALAPQGEGDLGRRLEHFFRRHLDAGARAVVAVGTDSPTLPADLVARAFVELEGADLVLGPAADGGYYLIGAGPLPPPVFENIAWGTSRVLADTVAALSEPHWRLALLPPWYDVDLPADWDLLAGHVAGLRRAGHDPGIPHTEALLRSPPR
jgi:rSAM/selenodomain-associated transferase 1